MEPETIKNINDLQDGWLQLGVSGAALFLIALIVYMFMRALSRMNDHIEKTNERWSGVVDEVTTRHDGTQKETNVILREFSSIMRGIEIKVDGHRGTLWD